jgi:hypothetical protein
MKEDDAAYQGLLEAPTPKEPPAKLSVAPANCFSLS